MTGKSREIEGAALPKKKEDRMSSHQLCVPSQVYFVLVRRDHDPASATQCSPMLRRMDDEERKSSIVTAI